MLVIAGHGVTDLLHAHPVGVVYRELRPLSVADAVELAEAMGLELPAEEVQRHHTFAAGNPLHLATGFDNLKRKFTSATGDPL